MLEELLKKIKQKFEEKFPGSDKEELVFYLIEAVSVILFFLIMSCLNRI